MPTSSPSGTRILSVPDAGASSSFETLSVSSTTSTSPLLTASPSFLRHEATLAEVTDSPEAGTRISTFAPEVEATGAGVAAGAGAGAAGAAAAGAALAAGALVEPEPPMRAMSAPIGTSSPSPTRISRTPSAAASSSLETLSVSSVTRMSPLWTMSPFALCQRATLAEVTDSPEAGTLTSVLMEMEGMDEWKIFQSVKACSSSALCSR